MLRNLKSHLLSLTIFCFGMILTFTVWDNAKSVVSHKIHHDFMMRTNAIVTDISDRLLSYEQVLWGGAGFVHATGHEDRSQWREYVSSLKLETNWPGIQGIGLSIPVSQAEKPGHIASMHAEGFPDYTIQPEGLRDEYSAIIFLEPFDWRNKRAFGYDMWSNPMRQDAMMRARDTGVAATSGIITLVQETDDDVQRGFLMYVPVYKQGMPIDNIEDRRQAFIGWVYSPFRMGDLMQGIRGNEPTDIAFEIYDNENFVQDSLLFDSDHQNAGNNAFENAYLKTAATIDLQGRTWGIRFASDAAQYSVVDRNLHWFIGAAGLTITLFVFAFTAWHANHKIRSTALIKLRTQGLEDEKRAAESARELAEKALLEQSFMRKYVDELALVSIIDADGNITSWEQRVVGQGIAIGTAFEQFMVRDGVDASSVEGLGEHSAYTIPGWSVDIHHPEVGVPVLWWRSVGHTHTAYVVETMMDELAEAAGADPVEFRLRYLTDPRARGVLELAIDKAGTVPEGLTRGIAVHKSFGSYVAEVADVRIREDGTVKVERVTCGVDCGVPINPSNIEAQVQGGLGYGLSAILREEITLTEGEVNQSNFYDYTPLRISDMPQVDVHIVQSSEAPTGIGEPGTPPIGPAVANAVRRATGTIVRELPFSLHGLA